MLNKLNQKVHPFIILLIGLVLLLGADKGRNFIEKEAESLTMDGALLQKSAEQISISLNEFISLRDLKNQDLEKFKGQLSGLAISKRTLYESGLSLQEEKRLLEKQLEMMTTYLSVDMQSKKIFLMRGEHSMNDYPVLFSPARAFGGVLKPLPGMARIASKERFAHPERGKSEIVDGKLVWNPPQVGTSLRSNALGEYVMFTNGDLILHGPQKKDAEHEAFPHYCLGLSLESAMKLYRSSFIGTRIVFKAPIGQ